MSRGRETVAIYVTFPDIETAETIGDALVESGLVACANLLPGMRSIYRWEGRIERADEIVGILKTQASRVDDVIAEVERRHPYDTPAIVVLPITKGSLPYLDWIRAETAT